jgi:hypothetical protein
VAKESHGPFTARPRGLGDQALILQSTGDLDGAMKLFKEQEAICRRLDDPDGLAISLLYSFSRPLAQPMIAGSPGSVSPAATQLKGENGTTCTKKFLVYVRFYCARIAYTSCFGCVANERSCDRAVCRPNTASLIIRG